MSELFPGILVETPADIRSAIAKCQQETPEYRLQTQNRSTKKCSLAALAQLAAQQGLDLQIALPKDLQQQLGELIDQLNIQTETSHSVALKPK